MSNVKLIKVPYDGHGPTCKGCIFFDPPSDCRATAQGFTKCMSQFTYADDAKVPIYVESEDE